MPTISATRQAQITAMKKRGLVTADEAARIANVQKSTIYSWMTAGAVHFERIGMGRGRVFVSLADVRQLAGLTA